MTACASSIINCSSSSTVRGLAAVLGIRPPLPFHFFKRWRLHDFHTSKWARTNPSAHIKRTRLGRSCIDQPTMDMVSVSRYGGYTQRESLATAFRVYRSVDQSEKARKAGQDALRGIQLKDFDFDAEEEQEVVVDFACLYLNACVLFEAPPTSDMMVQLLGCLATKLHSSFHWECVLCALIVCLQPGAGEVTAAGAAFVSMLRRASPDVMPESLSRDGALLLLLTIARALTLLPRTNVSEEDRQHLLHVQLKAIEMLCARSEAPLSREELLTVVDAVSWRHAVSECSSANVEWVTKVVPHLQLKKHDSLEALSVSQCTRLFCALCVLLAMLPPETKEWNQERQWQVLDPIVRHLDQRVCVHSVADTVCALVGVQANKNARSRYRKYPTALLDYLREQQQHVQKEADGAVPSLLKDDDSLGALKHVLSQLASSGQDELGDAAEALVTDLCSAVSA
ncbi:hypothetical protein DQ04_02991040 [Trypanosoma grayi]|uniref:hypothetical protein n=1 Tax=Trypanosoma grayi TaxID=71804 RepID=UPI0004F414E9|nr:hypothetical protein DQ04_02991040 [Trypanosoma grayi]KEG11088.1 hypothetical protein DQ04_02991040 [Trypanosoma grayi]